MRNSRLIRIIGPIVLLSVLSGFQTAAAQKPPAEILKSLKSAKDYQERMRAADTLARYPSPQSQQALLAAMNDTNEGVRATAAQSLAVVGDASAIDALRNIKDKNHVVRAAIQKSLILLEERFPNVPRIIDWKAVRCAIELGPLTNSSAIKREGMLEQLKKTLLLQIRMQQGFVAAPPPNGLAGLAAKKPTRNFESLVVLVNIKDLKKRKTGVEVAWEAAITFTVLNHPDRWIRAVLKNTGAAMRPIEKYTAKMDATLQDEALSMAVEQALQELMRKLVANGA